MRAKSASRSLDADERHLRPQFWAAYDAIKAGEIHAIFFNDRERVVRESTSYLLQAVHDHEGIAAEYAAGGGQGIPGNFVLSGVFNETILLSGHGDFDGNTLQLFQPPS